LNYNKKHKGLSKNQTKKSNMKNQLLLIDLLANINNILVKSKSKNHDIIINAVITEIGIILNLDAIYLFENGDLYSLKSCWENAKIESLAGVFTRKKLTLTTNFNKKFEISDEFIAKENIFVNINTNKVFNKLPFPLIIPIKLSSQVYGFFMIFGNKIKEASEESYTLKKIAETLAIFLESLLPEKNKKKESKSGQDQVYQNFLNHLTIPLSVLDQFQNYIFINKNELNNYKLDTCLIGKNDFDYANQFNLPIEIAKNRQALFNKVIEEKVAQSIEEIITHQNGDIKYGIRWMVPVSEKGKLLHVISYCIDRTELKTQETLILKQHQALDNAAIGLSLLDKQGNYFYMNTYHAQIFGYQVDELIGKNWTNIYDDEEVKKISTDYFPQLIANGFWTGETNGLKKNGTPLTQEIALTAFPDGGLACMTKDITALKTELDKVKLMNNQLDLALNSTNLGMWTYHIEEKRIEYHDAFLHLLGFTREEIPELTVKQWLNLMHQDDREKVLEILGNYMYKNQLGTTEEPFRLEGRMLHKNGKQIWFLGIGKIVTTNNNKNIMTGFSIDITPIKEAEIELKQALTVAKELNDLKTRFVTVVSHEFRTPLATIRLAVEVLKNIITVKDKKIDKLERIENKLNGIIIDVDRMTNLMADILTLGKVEASSVSLNRNKIEINEFLKNTVTKDLILDLNDRKLVIDLAKRDCFCFVDENLMIQILINLLNNAIKYSKFGDRIFIRSKIVDQKVIIEIEDEGIGISEEDVPYIFESFYRSKAVENITGTGLGMYIVKLFVEVNDGEVYLESKLNIGTKIILKLPLC
jgi:PAS domain S-box-containing protein